MNSIEKQILRRIGEDTSSPDVFTEANIGLIRQSVNDAIQELCMLTGSYQRPYPLQLYADRMFYRMHWEHDYFGWVVEAWDRSRNRRLTQTSLLALAAGDPFFLEHNGNPEEYVQVGDDMVGFSYKPSADGIVVELQCVCIPKGYAADTEPVKVRENFQTAAVQLGLAEYYASRGDARRASGYLEKYMLVGGLMGLNPRAQERIYQFGTEKAG